METEKIDNIIVIEEIKTELQKQKDLVKKLIGRLEFHESRWRRDVKIYESRIRCLNGEIAEKQFELDSYIFEREY